MSNGTVPRPNTLRMTGSEANTTPNLIHHISGLRRQEIGSRITPFFPQNTHSTSDLETADERSEAKRKGYSSDRHQCPRVVAEPQMNLLPISPYAWSATPSAARSAAARCLISKTSVRPRWWSLPRSLVPRIRRRSGRPSRAQTETKLSALTWTLPVGGSLLALPSFSQCPAQLSRSQGTCSSTVRQMRSTRRSFTFQFSFQSTLVSRGDRWQPHIDVSSTIWPVNSASFSSTNTVSRRTARGHTSNRHAQRLLTYRRPRDVLERSPPGGRV